MQIVLSDPHYWGGLRQVQSLSHLCEVLGMGLSMHSNSHLGISYAAMIQKAFLPEWYSFAKHDCFNADGSTAATVPPAGDMSARDDTSAREEKSGSVHSINAMSLGRMVVSSIRRRSRWPSVR